MKEHRSLGPYLGNLSLVAVLLGFVLTKFFLPASIPGHGFALAFFEAGIAGALADWFAVTALFRHPLGIPVPHTNLLVEKRHSLEDNIEAMIRQLLAPDNVREMLQKVRLPELAAQGLKNPDLRKALHREVPELLDAILNALRVRKVAHRASRWGTALLLRYDYAPLLATLLEQARTDGRLERLLSLVLGQTVRLFDRNADAIADYLGEKVHQNRGVDLLDRVVFFFTGRDIKQKLLPLLRNELVGMAHQEDHPLREVLRQSLQRYIEDLEHDESTRVETNRWVRRGLQDLDLPSLLERGMDRGFCTLQELLAQRTGLDGVIDDVLDRLVELLKEESLDRRLKGLLTSLVESRFVDVVASIARYGLARMSDEQFSGFIEERVYEDLQYIRLNGAVVGGLAGMLIYALALL